MKTSIRRIGNSAGAILPAQLLKNLHLSEGDAIEITEDGDRIVIERSNDKPRYQLKNLLKQCDESAPMPKALQEWDKVKPVGQELL